MHQVNFKKAETWQSISCYRTFSHTEKLAFLRRRGFKLNPPGRVFVCFAYHHCTRVLFQTCLRSFFGITLLAPPMNVEIVT